jgi:hypothetical protein
VTKKKIAYHFVELEESRLIVFKSIHKCMIDSKDWEEIGINNLVYDFINEIKKD